MNGIFNFLGKLFSGIFGFIGGLLGGKNKSGYYLELETAKGLGAATPAAEPAPKAPAEPKATTKSDKSNKSKKAVKTVTNPDLVVTDGMVAKAAAGVVADESPKPIAAEISKVTKTQATKSKQVPASNNGAVPEASITNFATDYLTPIATTGRRRPGANMRSFLDMAKQVKTSN
jgi:hypothetical protein